jgi:hypothetical protein
MSPRSIEERVRRGVLVLLLGIVLALTLVLTPSPACAQGSYRAVPTGGRSALMGNTGVAEARDGAAPFLNPATIVGIADSQVAFSVNFYSGTITTIDSFHAPRGADVALGREKLSDARLDALPSTFCLFLTLGQVTDERPEAQRRKLAVCAGTSERRELSASASAVGDTPDGRHTLHIASLERSYGRVHVGPTYGASLSDSVAIGASLHLVDTRVTSLTTADATTIGEGGDSFSSSVSATSFDIALLLGATLRIDRATTLGLAFGPPSLHMGGEIDAADHSQGPDYSATRAATGHFSAPLPMRAALGIARRIGRVRIAADATYFFAKDEAFRSDVDAHTIATHGGSPEDRTDPVTATTDARPVLDSALGIEWFMSSSISVLGGFATDFGATRRLSGPSTFGTVVTTREDRAVATLGLGSYGGGSALLFGMQLGLARGQTYVGDSYATPNDLAPVSQHTTTLLFVVAGSTTLSTIRRTFEDLRHTIPIR